MGGRGRGRSGNKPTGGGRGAKGGRSRKSYFFYISSVLGSYSLHVGYKNTNNIVQPLSASVQNAPVKLPFGPVHYGNVVCISKKKICTTLKNHF